nr:unnamed protein product [Digitaria exilis]
MATTSLASSSSSPRPLLFRGRWNHGSAFRASSRGRLPPIRCSSPQPATGGEAEGSERRRLSEQSSWEAKDADGDDYLYRLGKEAENMDIAVGARAGVVDDLFVGNFLGKDSDIVFDYRQKATRTFEYLQGDYYIAPLFLDKVACHIVKNFIAHHLNIKVPLILGIWGGKGQGKTFQTELIFRTMGVEPVIMSAGELESERAGEPGRLIRDRYRTASQWVDQIGGHEKLGEKLLKQKKGDKLPTFIPPKPTLDALIESGHSLVREQELVMNSKLSKEYMKNLED